MGGNVESNSLQALIDLPSTFLSACGIGIPGQMQGVDQLPVWTGQEPSARNNVIVEFRHQPTKVHLRTYIEDRWKITLYRDRPEIGELFDLQTDPDERVNRWNDADYAVVKAKLYSRWLNAEIVREPTRYPRIASA